MPPFRHSLTPRIRRRRWVAVAAATSAILAANVVASPGSNAATVSSVYVDALGPAWANWSYSTTVNLAATGRTGMGIGATVTAKWGGLSLRSNSPVPVTPSTVFTFYGNPGAAPLTLEFLAGNDSNSVQSKIVTFSLPANAWTPVTITSAQLGTITSFTRFQIGGVSGDTTPAFTIDDIEVATTTGTATTAATTLPATTLPATTLPATTLPPTTSATTAPPTGNVGGTITVNAGQLRNFPARFKGSNASSYEKAWSFNDPTIQARANNLYGNMRFPGGQLSQYIGWASCLLGSDMPNAHPCGIPFSASFATVTDFGKLMRATNTPEAIVTFNINATAKENAALAAWFNGAVGDTRVIGVDQKGADWRTVGYWAQLRANAGLAAPFNVVYFEFGNETYGGQTGLGCMPPGWGWEVVYTCDPGEYLNGKGTGAARYDGYTATKNLVKSLFPSALLGATIADPIHASWNNVYVPYAQGMLRLGSSVIDYLVVHEYMRNGSMTTPEMLAFPETHWTGVRDRITAMMDQYAGRRIPMYETEYGLAPVMDNDTESRSNWVANGLVMTDSIGQLEALGYIGASQFNLFSTGQGPAGNRYYGQMRNDGSFTRSPIYWGSVLWSRFGNQMASTSSTYNNQTTISAYGGKTTDGRTSVLVINKTSANQTSRITLTGAAAVTRVTADVASGASMSDWTMLFNGIANPSNDLTNAPSTVRTITATNSVVWTFPPNSMTLLRLG